MSEERLSAIENSLAVVVSKVDRMAELMEVSIRTEERLSATLTQQEQMNARLNKQGGALDNIAVKLASVEQASGNNEWFVRALIVALVGAVAYALRG